jgi:hypothetical protein
LGEQAISYVLLTKYLQETTQIEEVFQEAEGSEKNQLRSYFTFL